GAGRALLGMRANVLSVAAFDRVPSAPTGICYSKRPLHGIRCKPLDKVARRLPAAPPRRQLRKKMESWSERTARRSGRPALSGATYDLRPCGEREPTTSAGENDREQSR